MTTLVDYSSGLISGVALKNAGVSGAIRYVGTPQYTKNTTPTEVASLHTAGLEVHGVYETSTNDFIGGFNAGVANALKLSSDANHCGVDGVLFMSADQHLTSAQLPTWVQYVRGAATILGNRLGVYGFSEAMVAAQGLAHFFWQCGSHPAITGTAGFVHVWQRNSGQMQTVINGIVCDLNDVLKPLGVDMPLTQADADLVAATLLNWAITTPGKPAGSSGRAVWDVLGDGERIQNVLYGDIANLIKATATTIETAVSGSHATGAPVDPVALATALAPVLSTALEPLLPVGVTPAQVVAALAAKLS